MKTKMKSLVEKLSSDGTYHALRIQSEAMYAVHDYMRKESVVELRPVILSSVTDPLNHDVRDASIEYMGQKLQLTKSMILHKQLALTGVLDKIYIVSPNVRLETEDCAKSGRHLIEFSQVDIEFKGKGKEDFMSFMEGLFCYVVESVIKNCADDLRFFGRELRVPERPFKVYESKSLEAHFGKDYEAMISKASKDPFWILDLEREFYDREDPARKGYYHNYDMVYPEGFGEALSGGERDFEYEVLVGKMKERGMDLSQYSQYLEFAKEGLLPRTVGGGFGVERMVRYLTGAKDIDEVTLFSRKPGEKIFV